MEKEKRFGGNSEYPTVGMREDKKQMPFCNEMDRVALPNLKGCPLIQRFTVFNEKCALEPHAVKVARVVLRGGKLAKAYLSQSQGFAT